jgi:hypothetical protein
MMSFELFTMERINLKFEIHVPCSDDDDPAGNGAGKDWLWKKVSMDMGGSGTYGLPGTSTPYVQHPSIIVTAFLYTPVHDLALNRIRKLV